MEGITSPPAATNSNNDSSVLSPLLICTLGIAVTALAIIVYHFFLVKCCVRRHQTTLAPQSAISQQPITTGVDKNVLDTIPILAFSVLKRDEFVVDQGECVVCLGELKDDDMVRLLPNCKHAFHVPCIDQWLAAHTSCPLCRSPPTLVQVKDDEFSISVTSARVNSSSHESMGSNQNYCDEISSPRVQSSGLLRHCSSLNLSAVEKKSSSGLKRSLSMDQLSFVVINLQTEKEAINCSSTSSSSSSGSGSGSGSGKFTRSESYRTRSLSHFDRVSSKLLSSFSRLRLGKGNVDPILPF